MADAAGLKPAAREGVGVRPPSLALELAAPEAATLEATLEPMLRVFVVIPARDEAPRIGRVLRTLSREIAGIIVVDDGSLDDTAVVTSKIAEHSITPIELVQRARSIGVGSAIREGYRRALALGADVAVVMAGDGQMDPRDLDALLEPLRRRKANYVKGNRLAWPNGARAFPRDRLFGIMVLAALTRWATGLSIHDAQCGYTAADVDAMRAFVHAPPWDGYGYPNHLLVICARAGLRVAEVPVRPIYEGAPSRLSVRHVPAIVRALVRETAARRVFGGRSRAEEPRSSCLRRENTFD